MSAKPSTLIADQLDARRPMIDGCPKFRLITCGLLSRSEACRDAFNSGIAAYRLAQDEPVCGDGQRPWSLSQRAGFEYAKVHSC